MVEHKHFFKDAPYCYGSGNGCFYQTGERDKDDRVVYLNDITLEKNWLSWDMNKKEGMCERGW